ncbi:biotin transporter BioY [Candidatus Woesearchaeota archaeon]|nr:biotin transporter BioY [Candidatus Woesearchaeota archaeon]
MKHVVKDELRHKTMYELFFRHRNTLVDMFYMALGAAVLAGLSQIRIPLWPVPITMQTFGVFLIAFFFGSRKGALTLLLYMLAGILGLGVFAGRSSGMDVILGASGGYIIGFLVAAYAVGHLIEKGAGRTKKSIFGCLLLGNGIIYALGLIGLWVTFPNESFLQILKWGIFPFLIGDLIKILGAMALFPALWKAGEKMHG